MNRHILIVGNGKAEQAIAEKLRQLQRIETVSIAPGNVPVEASDVDGLLEWAKANQPDLTIVGPIEPLAAGIVDRFEAEDLSIFGPTKAAARLETSRIFGKNLMRRLTIPTASYRVFDSYSHAMGFLLLNGERGLAIKADGLAPGHDVYLTDCAHDAEKAVRALMVERVAGKAGARILIEDAVDGPERTFLAFSDGRSVAPIGLTVEEQAAVAGVGTSGRNGIRIGGHRSHENIIGQATIDALREDRTPFIGVLTIKMKLAPEGIKVLSANAHFDGLAETVVRQLGPDFLYMVEACLEGH